MGNRKVAFLLVHGFSHRLPQNNGSGIRDAVRQARMPCYLLFSPLFVLCTIGGVFMQSRTSNNFYNQVQVLSTKRFTMYARSQVAGDIGTIIDFPNEDILGAMYFQIILMMKMLAF